MPATYRSPAERAHLLAQVARPFRSPERARLGALLQRIGDASVVLLGGATNGARETHQMRTHVTRALIEHLGFTVVALDADWRVGQRLNQRAAQPTASVGDPAATDFLSWEWENEEVAAFTDWLGAHATGTSRGSVSIVGLDLYERNRAISMMLDRGLHADDGSAERLRRRLEALFAGTDPHAASGTSVSSDSEVEKRIAEALNRHLLRRITEYDMAEEFARNTSWRERLTRGADDYYRKLVRADPLSEELRAMQMFAFLVELMDLSKEGARIVVWTDSASAADESGRPDGDRQTLGTLCRQHFGIGAYLVGSGSHDGAITAAARWGGEPSVVPLPPAADPDSYEHIFHESGVPNFFLPLRKPDHRDVRREMSEPRLQRAPRVLYRAEDDAKTEYVVAPLTGRFDEYVWMDRVSPVLLRDAPTD